MNRNEILEAAKATVAKRGEAYGDAKENFERVAALWSYILDYHVEVHHVPSMMIALKLARLTNDPSHRDSMIDIAGYAALWSECVDGSNIVNYEDFTSE